MIGIYQPALIIKRMIQHATTGGVLYVEKVVQEVDRTCDRICTLTEFVDLLLRVDLSGMWCLDQHHFCGFAHAVIYGGSVAPRLFGVAVVFSGQTVLDQARTHTAAIHQDVAQHSTTKLVPGVQRDLEPGS